MVIKVRVVTNSSSPGVEAFEGGLKVRVKARPIEGKANEEVVKLLAQHFKKHKSQVRIVKGFEAKNKFVEMV